MFFDSWVLHWFILSNLGLLAIAVINFIYRAAKGYGENGEDH